MSATTATFQKDPSRILHREDPLVEPITKQDLLAACAGGHNHDPSLKAPLLIVSGAGLLTWSC